MMPYKNSSLSNIFIVRANSQNEKNPSIPASVIESWHSLPDYVRSALVSSELASTSNSSVGDKMTLSSVSTVSSNSSDKSSNSVGEKHEVCPITGDKVILKPLEMAPNNVFTFEKTHAEETKLVEKVGRKTITTTKKTVTSGRGWRNTFNLPISYDVNMVEQGTLLDPSNPQLLHATGPASEEYKKRFAVIDACVDEIYGEKIRAYFTAKGIDLHTCIINGGENDKRSEAVDTILDDLCVYKLRRREPFLAIGGGVILDIAGMAACLYRRGVPFVRVPTTLLAIVDASVGVKNGVDYSCVQSKDTYKNRVGSFYAPSSCLLDNSFIASQDERNIANGIGEIVKLALVRSSDLFELLESHGPALITSRFTPTPSVPNGVSDRIIDASIQIMLEELGPNLWEYTLDRCVDYGTYDFLHLM